MSQSYLEGRLVHDVEVKQTSTGVAVAQFRLAVNRSYKNANGEREADFINCVIWRKSAENLANFTVKGALISVKGRLQTRSYQDADSKTIYVTELVVEQFYLLESKKNGTTGTSRTQTSSSSYQGVGQVENAASHSGGLGKSPNKKSTFTDPFADSGNTIHIEDDDLPF